MRATMTADERRPAPWYRQRWPWLLMAGPAIVVVAGFWTLWVAIDSDDGLVADDYYKRGLAINRTLERSDRAAALGLSAVVDVDDAGRARVALSSAVRDNVAIPVTVRLSLVHPTRAGHDRRGELVRGPDGDYVGSVPAGEATRTLVIVETDHWRLPTVEVAGPLRGVRIDAGAR
ncbi:MAG: FixH family protein [Burkholderiales bacterium]